VLGALLEQASLGYLEAVLALGPVTWTANHPARVEHRPAYGVLAHVAAHSDLGQREPLLVEAADLRDLLTRQLAPVHRNRPMAQVDRDRGAMHTKVLGDLPHGPSTDVHRHQLVDLSGVENSLSHPNRADQRPPRVPNPRF
jgi:hypothetical protein